MYGYASRSRLQLTNEWCLTGSEASLSGWPDGNTTTAIADKQLRRVWCCVFHLSATKKTDPSTSERLLFAAFQWKQSQRQKGVWIPRRRLLLVSHHLLHYLAWWLLKNWPYKLCNEFQVFRHRLPKGADYPVEIKDSWRPELRVGPPSRKTWRSAVWAHQLAASE